MLFMTNDHTYWSQIFYRDKYTTDYFLFFFQSLMYMIVVSLLFISVFLHFSLTNYWIRVDYGLNHFHLVIFFLEITQIGKQVVFLRFFPVDASANSLFRMSLYTHQSMVVGRRNLCYTLTVFGMNADLGQQCSLKACLKMCYFH